MEKQRDELTTQKEDLTTNLFANPVGTADHNRLQKEYSEVTERLGKIEKEIENVKLESEKEEERARQKNEKEELLKRKEELTNKLYINPVGTPKHEEFQKQYSEATDRLQEIEKAGEEKKEPKMETKGVEKKTGIEELVKFFDKLSKAKYRNAEKEQKEFSGLKERFLENILSPRQIENEFIDIKKNEELLQKSEKFNLLKNHLFARIIQTADEKGKDIAMSEIYEGEEEEYKKDEKRLIGLLTEIGIEEKVCNKKEMDKWEEMPIDEFLTNILKVKEISKTGLNKSKFERMLSYK